MSEWEKLRGDLIAALQGTDWNKPEGRAWSAAELGRLAWMLEHDIVDICGIFEKPVAADSSTVNPDSGSTPAGD